MADELFTVSQAAGYLQVCEKTIRRLIKNHQLLASKIGTRSWRVKKTDIEGYLQTHTNRKKGADAE